MNTLTLNRREFSKLALAATGVALTSDWAFGAELQTMFTMGSQSYSFRNFSFEDSLKRLKELGLTNMEFCSVHFPCDPANEKLGSIKDTIAQAGVKVVAFGVEGFSKDFAANRKKFEFAKALGIGILSADPMPESFDNLDELCKEFDIKIAIHNHGPKARYDKVDDTLRAVEKHSEMIGACVDTGHVIRSGEKPHEVVKKLGGRVHSMHLKDWEFGGKERIVGEGGLELIPLVQELRAVSFSGSINLEYEESPDNPVPDMKIGLANWIKACQTA